MHYTQLLSMYRSDGGGRGGAKDVENATSSETQAEPQAKQQAHPQTESRKCDNYYKYHAQRCVHPHGKDTTHAHFPLPGTHVRMQKQKNTVRVLMEEKTRGVNRSVYVVEKKRFVISVFCDCPMLCDVLMFSDISMLCDIDVRCCAIF